MNSKSKPKEPPKANKIPNFQLNVTIINEDLRFLSFQNSQRIALIVFILIHIIFAFLLKRWPHNNSWLCFPQSLENSTSVTRTPYQPCASLLGHPLRSSFCIQHTHQLERGSFFPFCSLLNDFHSTLYYNIKRNYNIQQPSERVP